MSAAVEQYCVIQAHSRRAKCVSISADSKLVASSSQDGKICIWDSNGALIRTLTGHAGEVSCVVFYAASTLMSGGVDSSIRVWNAADGTTTHAREHAHTKAVGALAAAVSGAILVSGSVDKVAKLWSIAECALEEQHALIGHTDAITALCIARDARTIASASYDKTVRLWANPRGTALRTIAKYAVPVTALAMAPDGRWMASGLNDGTLVIAAAKDGKVIREIVRAHTDKISSACVDPRNGAWVASGGRDDHVRVHSVASGRLLFASKIHVDCVAGMAAAPDASWLASASHDSTVRLWRVPAGMR